jgi:hypothetical protein
MLPRLAVVLLAALWLAACAGVSAPSRPPEVARAYEDLEGAQPANLLRVSRHELIGRPIQGAGSTPHTIHYVLTDAKTGEARYVLATGADPGSYIMIPLSALQLGPGGIIGAASPSAFPSMSQLYMEHRFRPAQ